MNGKIKIMVLFVCLIMLITACGNTAEINAAATAGAGTLKANESLTPLTAETESVTAEENRMSETTAVSSGNEEVYATRKIENGTRVNLIVGDTVIPATLNDSKSARELISRLPVTQEMSHFTHDYCGVMEKPLSFDEKDVHNGWLNGDIDFATDGNYFTILYKDEDISKQFGSQVNMGIINVPLSVMDTLDSHITMRIELADQNSTDAMSSAAATSSASAQTAQASTISCSVNNNKFKVSLNDSSASKAFTEKLPLTLDMTELNGREKYYNFDAELTEESGTKPDEIKAGELMLWQGNCLVLFYNSFENTIDGYVKLGQIDDVTGLAKVLGSGNSKVTFESNLRK